jgi:hypothetical protein
MLMSALEGLAGVSKYQRPRGHKLSTSQTSVLKTTSHNNGDGCAPMTLLEWPILRTRSANRVLHFPALSLGDCTHFQAPALAADCSTFQGALKLDRNFRQVFHPRNQV